MVVVVGVAVTVFPVVDDRPVEGLHAYVTVPVLEEGSAVKVVLSPEQIVEVGMSFNTTSQTYILLVAVTEQP